MITLKALYDTIERFENKKLFKCDTIYVPQEVLNNYLDFYTKYAHVTYTDMIGRNNILFIGQNLNYKEETLTNEEVIIKEIIE